MAPETTHGSTGTATQRRRFLHRSAALAAVLGFPAILSRATEAGDKPTSNAASEASEAASVIYPWEPEWFLPPGDGFQIKSFAAIAPDKIGFSVNVVGESRHERIPYTRLYRCNQGRWDCSEFHNWMDDMTPFTPEGETRPGVAILSRYGAVWYVNNNLEDEQIDDPQLALGQGGFLYAIRGHGTELMACGNKGQFYRRRSGTWVRDDLGMRDVSPDYPGKQSQDEGKLASIYSTSTFDGGDWYACGAINQRPALYFRPAGETRWRWRSPTDAMPNNGQLRLWNVHASSPQDVWITAEGGICFYGNGREGFKEIGAAVPLKSRPHIYNVMSFQGEIYAGGPRCYHRLGDQHWEEVRAPLAGSVYASDPPTDAIDGVLSVSGGCLWAVGRRTISRFDGKSWTRIEIPPVYRTAR